MSRPFPGGPFLMTTTRSELDRPGSALLSHRGGDHRGCGPTCPDNGIEFFDEVPVYRETLEAAQATARTTLGPSKVEIAAGTKRTPRRAPRKRAAPKDPRA